MADQTKTLKATCLCGLAKHDVTLPTTKLPIPVFSCTCDSCRHMTGTLCNNLAALSDNDYKPDQALLDKLKIFQFSPRHTVYFCPICGCHVMLRFEPATGTVFWVLSSGTLEQADGVLKFRGYEYITDTRDGGCTEFLTHLNGKQLPRWPGHLEEGEQLPLGWRTDSDESKAMSTDRVHAYCKCRGVEFWVAHPSERSARAIAPLPDLIQSQVPTETYRPPPKKPDGGTWWLRANGTKFLGGVCVCNSCRLVSGTEVVQWAFVPTIDISLDAEGEKPIKDSPVQTWGTLKTYGSSPGVTRHFCGTCGSMVFFECEDRPKMVDVGVGLLDTEDGARAESLLEYRTQRLSFREDAIGRHKALVEGLEQGLKAYGEKMGLQ